MGYFRLRALFLGMLLVGLGGGATSTGPGAAGERSGATCSLPVAAEIADGFRPPAEPWLAGNRGLTFATEPGRAVRAVAPGRVTFAGRIAHHWYVTIHLADGRDVTYSFLSSVAVAAGDTVATGDPVGTTGGTPFHLGLRRDGEYLDPTELLFEACGWHHAVLVPVPA